MSNKIELKPLKYNLPPTLIGQVLKCQEEMDEFVKAILKDDYKNSIEEFHDVVQITLNTLRLAGVPIENIVEGQQEHYKKLIERGWKFDA